MGHGAKSPRNKRNNQMTTYFLQGNESIPLDIEDVAALLNDGSLQGSDLLRRAFAALNPGGRLVIQDHVMSEDKTAPRAGALFAVNMLVGTEDGGTFSEREYSSWLGDAGFARVTRIPLSGPNDLVIGYKS